MLSFHGAFSDRSQILTDILEGSILGTRLFFTIVKDIANTVRLVANIIVYTPASISQRLICEKYITIVVGPFSCCHI